MGLKKKIIAECEWAIAQIDNGSISVPETRSFFGCVRRILENEPSNPIVSFTRSDGTKAYSCPRCAAMLHGGEYCSHCGQKLEWKKELVDDFEKHLHGNKDGILYHHYCKKCEFDWWSEKAFPNRCSKCGCELI